MVINPLPVKSKMANAPKLETFFFIRQQGSNASKKNMRKADKHAGLCCVVHMVSSLFSGVVRQV